MSDVLLISGYEACWSVELVNGIKADMTGNYTVYWD